VALTAAWSEESSESHEAYETWRSRGACSAAEWKSTRSQYEGTRDSLYVSRRPTWVGPGSGVGVGLALG